MSAVPSRASRSARNAAVSVATQVLTVVLSFVVRSVFVATLGVEVLGVNTLLTSVVALLAVADLGVNAAIMFALYAPLREGDHARVAAIVAHAAKMFRLVALGVALVGLGVLPFLDRLIKLDDPVEHVGLYYLVLLSNAVVGYLMMNRVMLLNADQRIYLTKLYSLVFTVLRSIVQVVALLMWGSFLWFLVIQVVFTIVNNVFVFVRVGSLYPYLKMEEEELSKSERRDILRSVRAAVVYRVGGLVLNNSGPVLVSTIVGTLALGYYSNYLLVVGSVAMITEVAFAAIAPSVGNLLAAGRSVAGRSVFDEMVLLSLIVHGVVGVVMVAMLSDFVELWLGESFVLSPYVVAAIVLNFYVVGTQMPLWAFRSATGLFRETQYVIVMTAVASIGLSLLLGPQIGLAGVLIAPVLARLVTTAWYEPLLLVRRHLGGTASSYFVRQLVAVLIWVAGSVLVLWIGSLVAVGPLGQLAIKSAALVILLPVTVWLAFGRAEAFLGLQGRLRSVLSR